MVNTINLKSYLSGEAMDSGVPVMKGFSRLRVPTPAEREECVDVDWAGDVAAMAQNKASGMTVDFSDEELCGAIDNLLCKTIKSNLARMKEIDFIELSDCAENISLKGGKDCGQEIRRIRELVA